MSASETSATSSMSFSRYSCASAACCSGISICSKSRRPDEVWRKAFMSTRSITPSSSCSAPSGISVATTCWPKERLSCSSTLKKSARSRSSMFTNTSRAMSSDAARSHRRAVCTSTPSTPLTTKIADSHTRSAESASAKKLGSPGVSSRLILRSSHSNELSVVAIDICRSCSSTSASEIVVPSVTVPSRVVTPASKRSAS